MVGGEAVMLTLAEKKAGRAVCARLFPGPIYCEVCGAKAERHHKDDNQLNNARENIAFLCRKHHFEADGRMRRPERRAAVSAIHKGRAKPDSQRQKIREANTGRKRSPETCAAIGASKRGPKLKPEHIEKVAAAIRGQKRSPEQRARQSEVIKMWWAARKSVVQAQVSSA